MQPLPRRPKHRQLSRAIETETGATPFLSNSPIPIPSPSDHQPFLPYYLRSISPRIYFLILTFPRLQLLAPRLLPSDPSQKGAGRASKGAKGQKGTLAVT